MQNSTYKFTQDELETMSNKEFFFIKHCITDKIILFMEQTRENYRNVIKNLTIDFPQGTDFTDGKISKGENYELLPYLILDYPRLFTPKNTLAIRTMFWWGEGLNITFLLGGDILQKLKNSIKDVVLKFKGDNVFFCIHHSSWQYHFRKDNYLLISETSPEIINTQIDMNNFIKITQRFNIQDYEIWAEKSMAFFKIVCNFLKKSL